MYQALYRKWRPRTFDEVVGQEHITVTLKNQVRTERLSHAYLFIGSRGTGKTSCAKILARAVNCENPQDGNPCNSCDSCRGIESGAILDVEELDAASNNGVDNIRALRDNAVFSPVHVRKRVYIVDEVHMLSMSAFNALLKILEEPPGHLMFILATTELHKVPATILSRCQRHSFRRVSAPQIKARLELIGECEGLGLMPEAAELLSGLADGSLRDALSLLDQCSGREAIGTDTVLSALGLAGKQRTADLFTAITGGGTAAALRIFHELWSDGKNPASLIDELSGFARDVLMLKLAPEGGKELLSGSYDPVLIAHFAGLLAVGTLSYIIERIQDTQSKLHYARSPKTAAELCIAMLCQPELNEGYTALLARIERLESRQLTVAAAPDAGTVPGAAPVPKADPIPEAVPVPEADPIQEAVPVPEADPIQEAVPVPEADSVPETTPVPKADPAPDNVPDDLAVRIADALIAELDVGAANIIRNFAAITATGTEIILEVERGFAYNVVNTPTTINQIRSVVARLAGDTLSFRIAQTDHNPSDKGGDRASFDSLAQFDNVTFE